MGTHCIALYANGYNITYSDSFGIKHIPKKIKKLRTKKNITKTIYRLQTNNSIMCGYFCILFIDFMLKGKSYNNYYNNLFFPNKYEKNDKKILNYFQ